jgi:hypothetical protein
MLPHLPSPLLRTISTGFIVLDKLTFDMCFKKMIQARHGGTHYNPSNERQEDHDFKVSLGYTATLCLKKEEEEEKKEGEKGEGEEEEGGRGGKKRNGIKNEKI